MKTCFAIACALAALAASNSPTKAEELRSADVSLQGLDLSTAEGMQVLQDRMARAISRVCNVSDKRSQQQIRAVRQCRRDLHAESKKSLAKMRGKGRSLAHTSVAVISK